MGKIWLIIKREYLVRVRKKSFIIMTILGPILMVGLMILPIYLANESQEERIIALYEKDHEFNTKLIDTEFLHFTIIPDSEAEKLKDKFLETAYYALLDINDTTFTLYSEQQISLPVISEIESQLENIMQNKKLKNLGVDIELLKIASKNINVKTRIVSSDGGSVASKTEASIGIGFLSGILIYIFIFMYGTMVMRGVIEEKTNRIIEVIISSVKPFQLMIGKILGVSLVGLTQFILWIILTITISALAEFIFLDPENITSQIENTKKSIIIAEINSLTGGINLTQIFLSFLFYFIGGYLMYSSLFAAVGSAVDNEADTQQFILPITVPLILAFILIQPIIDNPEGALAFWMSMIPFTSPIIMMVRLPFGVAYWELILSMSILILSFIASTYIAAKIYRVGILMYGKKITYKELWKWLNYKD